jgi:cystathionine gamma-synthase/cystathionine gamma-lyase/cystathionine beta-lyase
MNESVRDFRIETLAVRAGERRPGPEGSLVFPIYQGTVFSAEEGAKHDDLPYVYLRVSNTPTQRYLHGKLAALEGAEGGLATASGMAALTTILLTLLKKGDHLIAGECLYGGTHDFITRHSEDLGLAWTFVDPQRPETWSGAVRPSTRLFLVETITNPLLRVPRLRDVVAFAREHGLVSVIDNTFATPVNFRPLSIGFDLSFHSATKYLNGHSDLVAGCVMGGKKLIDRIHRTLNLLGGSLDPHAGFLLSRGLKTLALRIKAQNVTGLELARFLRTHPKVLHVNYPGLEDHPDHGHARELLSGFGGMLSLRLHGGLEAAARLIRGLALTYPAPSLGGVETLITRPAASSHAGMSPADRERIGVTEDLLRVSCGIEHHEDLIADFRHALEGV